MSRDMDTAVANGFSAAILNIAWIFRLDIEGDPIYAWTGLGPLVIAPGTYSDDKLNGNTYEGLANIAEMGKIVDTSAGSQAVKLALPGVRLDQDALQQVIYDQRKWQGLPGYIWVVPIGDNGIILGEPVRAKTGRMDNLKVEKRQDSGVVRLELESFNSYSQHAIMTRYSEQKELDPTDTSQNYVHDLANKTVGIGDKADKTGTGKVTGSFLTTAINAAIAKRNDASYL